jgi:Pyruvate/2-oxoacid:ferredoxin oxidoreductase delta subunit
MGNEPSTAECHGVHCGGGCQDGSEPDWEEWNPKQSSFVHHMIAGSVAGIAEHTVMFPVDTVKTHVQCLTCVQSCADQQVRRANQGGFATSSEGTRVTEQPCHSCLRAQAPSRLRCG